MTNTASKTPRKKKVAKKTRKKAAPKKTAKKRAAKKRAGKKRAGKRDKVNKSQAVRDYHASHPDEGPTAISRALAKQGIEVRVPQVSNVLTADKKKGKKKVKRNKQAAPGKSAADAAGETVNLDDLLRAQQFVDQVGGAESARRLIGVVEKVRG